MRLEKTLNFSYNFTVVGRPFFLQFGTSARHFELSLGIPQRRENSICLEERKTSPRFAARNGMKQKPYEFRLLADGITG